MITILKEDNHNITNNQETLAKSESTIDETIKTEDLIKLYNKNIETTNTVLKDVIDKIIVNLERLKDIDSAIQLVQSEIGTYYFDDNDIDFECDEEDLISLNRQLNDYSELSVDEIADNIKYELKEIIDSWL